MANHTPHSEDPKVQAYLQKTAKRDHRVDSIFRRVLHWIERFIAVITIISLLGTLGIEIYHMFTSGGEYFADVSHMLHNLLAIVVGLEFVRMLIDATPANILEGVERGIDFFDCVYPSRNGRHGHVYTHHGKLNLFNAKYERDMRPIEEGCMCPTCRNYSRAYVRHLLKAKEMLGMRMCVLHNLYFYNHLMEEIRDALDNGNFKEYKYNVLQSMAEGDR